MGNKKQYFIFSGIGILVILLIVMFMSPDMLFSPTITVAGSSYNKSSSDQISVMTKADLGSTNIDTIVPRDIGKWHGSDYDITSTKKALGADAVVMRLYEPDTFTQPIVLSIVQSKTDSSFHDPRVCLIAQGTTIEEFNEKIVIQNPEWTQENTNITLPINKVIVSKHAVDGKITQRSLYLIFYVKGNQFYNDQITMIETQALIPITGDYQDTFLEEQNFLSQVIPLMFIPSNQVVSSTFLSTLIAKGAIGYLIVIVLFLIPIVLIILPNVKGHPKISYDRTSS